MSISDVPNERTGFVKQCVVCVQNVKLVCVENKVQTKTMQFFPKCVLAQETSANWANPNTKAKVLNPSQKMLCEINGHRIASPFAKIS